jgi:CHAT domain-containing protein
LSACGTAAGPDSPIGGNLSLATPFLVGGIPTVVATRWSIDDRTAARLMADFHRRLARGEAPARALRAAKLAARSGAEAQPAISWASFHLLGSPL